MNGPEPTAPGEEGLNILPLELGPVLGKGRRRGTRILVGSNVDEGDFPGFRFACLIKGRANFVRTSTNSPWHPRLSAI